MSDNSTSTPETTQQPTSSSFSSSRQTPTPPPPPLTRASPLWEKQVNTSSLSIRSFAGTTLPRNSKYCPGHLYGRESRKSRKKGFLKIKFSGCSCPMFVSVLAVMTTLMVTVSVLAFNYSETKQRRLTKKQSVILDHWGKGSPLLKEEDLRDLLHGGITYYGETALRRDIVLPGDLPHIFTGTSDWGVEEEEEEKEMGEMVEDLEPGVMTRW